MTNPAETTRSLPDGPEDQSNRLERIASALSMSAEELRYKATCKKCGYRLYGLLPDGDCPECNFSIWVSLQGDALVFADPNYIRRLYRGTRWIKIGLIVFILSVILYVFLFLLYVWCSLMIDGFEDDFVVWSVPSVALLISIILIVIGAWYMLARDQWIEQQPYQITYRSLGRLLLFLLVCSWSYAIFGLVCGMFTLTWWFIVPFMISVACMWCVASHLVIISKRLREQSLQVSANGFRIYSAVFLIVGVLLSYNFGLGAFCFSLSLPAIYLLWMVILTSDFGIHLTKALDSSTRYRSTCKLHGDVKTITTSSGGTA